MPLDWTLYLCLAAGLSSALVAGVFQSFSDFVMKSLIAARPEAGIEAMQMINRKVFRSVFLVMLLGLAPASLALAGYAYLYLSGPAVAWIIAAASIYVTSVFLVTMFANVPMNERLDTMDPLTETATKYWEVTATKYWEVYGFLWTRWNHVRTLGSLATAICFLMAAVALA